MGRISPKLSTAGQQIDVYAILGTESAVGMSMSTASCISLKRPYIIIVESQWKDIRSMVDCIALCILSSELARLKWRHEVHM
jgi:hypothetical protein